MRFIVTKQKLWQLRLQLLRYGLPTSIGLAILSVILLPLNVLTTQRLHHDEALYATWALNIVSGNDFWLTDTPIDKPPLYLYTVAGAIHLLGPTETATRIPSLLATVAIVFLTFWLGRKLYSTSVGILAAWLVALSPFILLFAPTTFTDPMLVALALAGFVAAVHHRAGWAGMFLGLAITTKQQGIFMVPLAMTLLLINPHTAHNQNQLLHARANESKAYAKRSLWRKPLTFSFSILRLTLYVVRANYHLLLIFILTLLLTLLPALVWDVSRNQPSGFFKQSLINYGGLTLDITNFSERWMGFSELLAYGTASPLLNTLLLIGCPLLLLYGLWQIISNYQRPENNHQPAQRSASNSPKPQTGQPHDSSSPSLCCSSTFLPHALTDWLLALFILAFLLLHTILSFQVWDRYLLGLIPLMALLLARILLLPWTILKNHWLDKHSKLKSWLSPIVVIGLAWLLALTLSNPVQDAINARYPLGSNSHALQGIEQITAYLQGHVGADSTLHHHWLGTHWRFYLWDYPYDLQYWDSPHELATKAQPGQYLAYPTWRSDTEMRLALFKAKLSLNEITRAYSLDGTPSIILYQIKTLP